MVYCTLCGAANADDVELCFACQSPLSLDDVAFSPTSLLHDRYRLLHQVGSGGYGAVYKAEDTQSGDRLVALKMISLRGLKPQDVIDATDTFHRELQMLSELSHQSLPRIYEHFTDAEHWYLVMEFIEGETLESLLAAQHGPLALLETCHIGIQLCSVLAYLHSRQPAVIFRDLKPANVMVTPFKQIYLIDFGTARLFKPGRPHDTIAFGSPGYAAPEQYGKAQTTPRSDIYSLGATLHHLLTDIDPADDPFHFVSLAVLHPSLPSELSVLLSRMLSLHAAERPASMSEVKTELQRLSVEYARRLYPLPGTLSRLPASNSQYPYSQPSSANAYYIPSNSSSSSQISQQQVQMRQQQTTHSPKQGNLSRRAIVVSLAVLTFCGAGLLSQHSARHAHGYVSSPGEAGNDEPHTNFGVHQAPVTSLAWTSSSFDRLASISSDGTVVAEDVLSGTNLVSFSGPNQEGVTSLAAMHHSASLVALGLNGSGFTMWNSDVNLFYQAQTSIELAHTVRALSWSFDDARLAVAEGNEVHLFQYDVAASQFTWQQDLIGHDAPVSCLSWSPDGAYIATGSDDQTVRIWSTTFPGEPQVHQGHKAAILSVDWAKPAHASDVHDLASCSADGEIQIWRVQLIPSYTFGVELLNVVQHMQACSVAWAPGQLLLACACQNLGIWLWKNGLYTLLRAGGKDKSILSVAWSSDGSLLANGDSQGSVTIRRPSDQLFYPRRNNWW